jgi:hypothetical protein
MATYQEILDDFFYLRFPRSFNTFEEFEAADGPEDRQETVRLLKLMLAEAPITATRILSVDYFPQTPESFLILDERLDPSVAERLIAASNPDDENNPFKLTVCELAVHLGAVLASEYGGGWQFARYPNYFQSRLFLGTVEVHVFDIIMKKCSTDRTTESICDKIRQNLAGR